MEDYLMFSAVLGLSSPWKVTAVSISNKEKRMDISVDFSRRNTFACPSCGSESTVSHAHRETWHHENFFHFATYLHARVPNVRCHSGCGTLPANVPWERQGSRFVKLSGGLGE